MGQPEGLDNLLDVLSPCLETGGVVINNRECGEDIPPPVRN